MESCYFTVTKPSSSSSTILNFQGISSLGRRSSQKSLGAPSHLSWPSSRPNKKHQDFAYRWTSQNLGLKTFKGAILAEAGKQGWDFGRFIKTLYFFNGPPSPAKFFESLIEKLTGPSPSKPVNSMDSSGITLVTGATGGVGRRVVDVLRNKRLPVRVLVRNEEKARRMLGEDVDLVVGDVTKASTLLPEYFKGVTSVINAVSVIVGPKEGDTPDRAKYSQGIKFFEPEIKGDSPEMVEYIGMKNLINAVKENVGLRSGKLLFGYEGNSFKELPWGALDDVVMGGVSQSTFQIDLTGGENGGPTGLFKGIVTTANNGGFASIRTKLMFSKFEFDGKLNPTFKEGPFELPISCIRAYLKDPITPRFVHVSSAGVTRPERQGIDLSKQPPAVRLNKELGFILTFKLKELCSRACYQSS